MFTVGVLLKRPYTHNNSLPAAAQVVFRADGNLFHQRITNGWNFEAALTLFVHWGQPRGHDLRHCLCGLLTTFSAVE